MSNVANQVLPPRAAGGDPHLNVHTLGEFLYCQRAGLQAYEHQGRQDDEPPPVVHLSFMPPYELAELRELLHWQLQQTLSLCRVLVMAVLTSVLSMTFGAAWFAMGGAVSGMIAGLVGLWMLSQHLPRLWGLLRLHRQAERAGQQVLKDALDGPERINWWALLKGGCDSVPTDKLADVTTDLGGKPWRVLRRGALRIPVIRLRETKERLWDGHYAKVAAQCHLVHVSEPATLSPYGIILFGDTYTGFAIPNSPDSRSIFHRALVECRAMIVKAVEPDAPREAHRKQLCARCPWGFPVVYRPGKTETERFGMVVPALPMEGKDGRHYHSPCRDRFDWVPPHDKAIEKGLTLCR